MSLLIEIETHACVIIYCVEFHARNKTAIAFCSRKNHNPPHIVSVTQFIEGSLVVEKSSASAFD